MKISLHYLLPSLLLAGVLGQTAAADISLHGTWQYALDPEDKGIREQWAEKKLENALTLPGSLQTQGIGEDIGPNTKWVGLQRDTRSVLGDPVYQKYARGDGQAYKVPSWLQPDKYYQGVSWFQKEINLPEFPSGEWLVELERAHWETMLYVDGKPAGKQNSLGTPHRYLLKGLKPGKHMLTIRVDNRVSIPVGIDAHSVSDHTQSNWNGLIGRMTVTPLNKARIENVRLTPDISRKSVLVDLSVRKNPSEKTRIQMEVLTEKGLRLGKTAEYELPPGTGSASIRSDIALGEQAELWDEHHPALYSVRTAITSGKEREERKTTFGLREFKAEGTRFTINGHPVFLRGTLECCVFPKTGYPAMDETSWTRIFKQAKQFGLNHIRFHSWCPPEAAFAAADKLGMYLQVECGAWSMVVGDDDKLNTWIREEGQRILREYGNHPSFCLMAYGNEPSGKNHVRYLAELVTSWKKEDPRRVYTGAAGWPYLEQADYWNAPDPRIQAWGAGLNSRINALPPSFDYDFRDIIKKNMPTVSHEIGQWCVYPDFKEIRKYTGLLKAKNFELFREILSNKGMSDLAEPFLFSSGRLQTLCYKADIEAALRTPGMGGFQLLGLTDFPGQGTALVGVLNAFWDTKGYVDAEEYRTFCSDTVPLIRFPRMAWNNGEIFRAPLEIAHFGVSPLKNASVEWKVLGENGKIVASGSFTNDIPLGNAHPVGTVSFSLKQIDAPAKLTVEAAVRKHSGAAAVGQNSWNIWVYPAQQKEEANIPYMTHYFNQETRKRLARGENVLLTLKKGTLSPENGGTIAVGFSPIFWNTAWTSNQAPHTLGIYCNPKHPALAAFPNDGHTDWQWWDIIKDSSAIILDSLPHAYRPVIHYIDDWFVNRKLGLLMEMKVGPGKLLVCGADLEKDMEKRPAARQFLHSLRQYMQSPAFNPSQEIPVSLLERILPSGASISNR